MFVSRIPADPSEHRTTYQIRNGVGRAKCSCGWLMARKIDRSFRSADLMRMVAAHARRWREAPGAESGERVREIIDAAIARAIERKRARGHVRQ